jgi:GNAT superfamily N-acetyltransferase
MSVNVDSVVVTSPAYAAHELDISAERQIEGIEKIHESVGWTHYNGTIASEVRQYQEQDDESGSGMLLAILNNQVCGYVCHDRVLEDKIYVSFIAVDAEIQAKRIGRKLMQGIFDRAVDRGMKEIYLDFRGRFSEGKENGKLLRFYTGLHASYNLEKKGHGQYTNGDTRYAITYRDLADKSELASTG